MTVSLSPLVSQAFETLVASIWPNRMYLLAAVDHVVPYQYHGARYVLSVSAVGVPVKVRIDRSNEERGRNHPEEVIFIPRQNHEVVLLPMTSGVNRVTLTSALGNLSFSAGCANWATPLEGAGQEIDEQLILPLDARDMTILSPTGSFPVERFFAHSELLPLSNSLYRLCLRLLTGAFGEAAKERSARALMTGLTGSTPVVVRSPLPATPGPHDFRLLSSPADFGGFDFHAWTFDLCLTSFRAALIYLDNLPNFEVVGATETLIAFQRTDLVVPPTEVLRQSEDNLDSTTCSIEERLRDEGCFDHLRPWVRLTITTPFVICYAVYGLDTGVEVCYALGVKYWDCGNPLDDTIDSADDEDPTGDGWVGTGLDGRWDFPLGGGFDSLYTNFPIPSDPDDYLNQCPWPYGPPVTPLMTEGTEDVIIDKSGPAVPHGLTGPGLADGLYVFGSLIITSVPGGGILSPM